MTLPAMLNTGLPLEPPLSGHHTQGDRAQYPPDVLEWTAGECLCAWQYLERDAVNYGPAYLEKY